MTIIRKNHLFIAGTSSENIWIVIIKAHFRKVRNPDGVKGIKWGIKRGFSDLELESPFPPWMGKNWTVGVVYQLARKRSPWTPISYHTPFDCQVLGVLKTS